MPGGGDNNINDNNVPPPVSPVNEGNPFIPGQNSNNNRGDRAEGESQSTNAGGVGGSISSAGSELLYSGLYSYHVPTNTWTLLR